MDSQNVDAFILANNKYFRDYQIPSIRHLLLNMDDSRWVVIQSIQFKDPALSLILSILVGSLGIDRFYIGDTGLGIGKLITCGGCGIWTIIDWFLIMGAAKDKNIQKLQSLV